MTEEVIQEVGETQEPEQREFTQKEQEALSMGWRPKEEWDGDEEDFIDAREFVRRQSLFDKISSQNQEIRQIRTALAEFKQHYTNVEKVAVERAMKELKAEQKAALERGDVDSFQNIQDELETARDQVRELESSRGEVPQAAQPNPEFQAWVNKNRWYATEEHMKVYADKVGIRLAAMGAQPAEVLREVEKAVRKEFPNKFSNPNRERPGVVEGTNTPARQSTKQSTFVLTAQEEKIMKDLVKQKVLTKEEYIADLKTQFPNR